MGYLCGLKAAILASVELYCGDLVLVLTAVVFAEWATELGAGF